jgi:hypothetical protein
MGGRCRPFASLLDFPVPSVFIYSFFCCSNISHCSIFVYISKLAGKARRNEKRNERKFIISKKGRIESLCEQTNKKKESAIAWGYE